MIQRVYWDTVWTTSESSSVAPSRCLHAIWPSPIDADACFQRAGFTEFADTNGEWDSDWQAIVDRTIAYLARIGPPAIRAAIVPVTENRLLDRVLKGAPRFKAVVLSLTEQAVLTTMDDQFGHAVIDFGDERAVTLVTGDGHPILWIFAVPRLGLCAQHMATEIGQGRGIAQLELDWSILAPTKVSV